MDWRSDVLFEMWFSDRVGCIWLLWTLNDYYRNGKYRCVVYSGDKNGKIINQNFIYCICAVQLFCLYETKFYLKKSQSRIFFGNAEKLLLQNLSQIESVVESVAAINKSQPGTSYNIVVWRYSKLFFTKKTNIVIEKL